MPDVKPFGLVGEHQYGGGAQAQFRLGPFGEQIVNDVGWGRYFEAVRAGRMFSSFVKTVTIAATHNSPITAATATPILGLYNPANSNTAAVFTRIAPHTTSGTPAGGQFVLNAMTVTTVTTASQTGSIFSNLLQSNTVSPQGSAMRVYNNIALTGIVPIASNEVALVGGAAAAAAAGNGGPGATGEDVAGQFILPPGTLAALMAGTGAGTSWIVNASWTWVEIPYSIVAT
jgi:hypothetical protein